MAIRTKNLNLIPLLQALLEEENVAKAADKMALSQPAMSSALARLRDTFNDDLMVRTGRSMQLTPRAIGLKEQLNEVCEKIDLLFQPQSFSPATANLTFRIAAPHYISFMLTDLWIKSLAEEAPGIKIEFVDVPGDLTHWMDHAIIDLAVCAEFNFWPELNHQHLFRDRAVALMSNKHPLSGNKQISSKEISQFPSISMISDANTTFSNKRQDTTGIPSFDLVSQISSMNQFTSMLLSSENNVITRTEASISYRMQKILPLSILEIVGEETEFDTRMFWSKINEKSLEHEWLRNKVCHLLSNLTLS